MQVDSTDLNNRNGSQERFLQTLGPYESTYKISPGEEPRHEKNTDS